MVGRAWSLVGIVVTVIALYQAIPRLSVSEGSSLDSKNPYSSLFTVANEGYLAATNLDAVCQMSFSDNHGNSFGSFVTPYPKFAESLHHADKVTLPCFRSLEIGGGEEFSKVGDLNVAVRYYVWPFKLDRLFKYQRFHFRATPGPDGQMHWTYVS
jgi:hypothetical protein